MGGLRQAAFCRTSARARLCGPLYASCSHLQPSPLGHRKWPSPVPMERLPRQQPAKDHDAGCRRVHPPVSSAHTARGIPAYSLLRSSRQSLPATKPCPLSATTRYGVPRIHHPETVSRPVRRIDGLLFATMPRLSARLHGHHRGPGRPSIPLDPKHFMRMVTHATDQRPTSLALPTRKGNLVHNMPIHRSEDPLHWSPPIKMPEFSSVCHPTPRPDSVPWTSLAFLKDSANHSIPIGVLPAV